MLSHKNVVANLTAFEYTLKAFLKDGALDKDDVSGVNEGFIINRQIQQPIFGRKD